jgi:hypothetical protein
MVILQSNQINNYLKINQIHNLHKFDMSIIIIIMIMIIMKILILMIMVIIIQIRIQV